jgi:hypothetical protein
MLLLSLSLSAQNQGSTKGNGQVFFQETFGWGNPDDPKGWTAPAGYYFLDPTDNGYNWHWYPMDSLKAQWVNEPPFMSTTAQNGSLTLFADKYNEYKDPTIPLDNSIGFPPIDCSSHGSVIVRYETVFMNYSSGWKMLLEVSVDNWVHSAQYDVGFGCGHKGRPNNTAPGVPAIFEANISDVAAGQSNVQFRFTWRGTDDYFWQIDDFSVAEAWDNDLQMKFFEMEWIDADAETVMTPFYMIPKTQLGGGALGNFKSAVLNFGEYDQSEVSFNVNITKNNQSVFTVSSPKKNLYTLVTDTILLENSYAPAEYGHYKIEYGFGQKDTENTPANNGSSAFFNVTDSVYSHADNSAEEAFAYGFEAYGSAPNLNHIMSVIYPITADCQVNSISAYIAGGKADQLIDFKYKLFLIPQEGDDTTPIELLMTDAVTLDSAMLNTWVTMDFQKNGESELLKAGNLVCAAVEYNNLHEDLFSRRYDNLKIGADYSFKIRDAVTWVGSGTDIGAGYGANRNLMIRLNIDEHGNRIDSSDPLQVLSSVGQNYPNPFSETTRIDYKLANSSEVSLIVRDLTGRIVLESREGFMPAGSHQIHVDGSALEPGIYLYSLTAGNLSETKRMTITR